MPGDRRETLIALEIRSRTLCHGRVGRDMSAEIES